MSVESLHGFDTENLELSATSFALGYLNLPAMGSDYLGDDSEAKPGPLLTGCIPGGRTRSRDCSRGFRGHHRTRKIPGSQESSRR